MSASDGTRGLVEHQRAVPVVPGSMARIIARGTSSVWRCVLRYHTLTRQQRLARPVGEVFDFFADAGNLEAITPPSLRFRVVSPLPIAMEAGALIEYRLRIRGVPLMWLTRIETWEPGRRFVDAQLAGPYALWHHTHEFESLGDGATLMRDVVRYALPFGPVGEVAHAAFVRGELAAIFDFRHAEVARRFGAS